MGDRELLTESVWIMADSVVAFFSYRQSCEMRPLEQV